MSKRFFRLKEDVHAPGRWHLGDPVNRHGYEIDDPRDFNEGRPVQLKERLSVPIEYAGRPLDFTLTALSVPIVHIKVAALLAERAPYDIQLMPVDVPGHPDQYLIWVATKLIRCIDEKASKVQLWMPEEGLPEKVGQYYAVDHLRIDRMKVGEVQVFRTEGWPLALIVSENIREGLDQMDATGMKFEEV
ncbi:imm11 family protein [Stigmatella erecta]|uniref:Immunity MXAN-0049 protein domain-containing protein n=1 Tax=Stigmatella erecta TaxID=83460 RepID=A0A1I0KCP9_9BACT|nr:DUF1629 domain-containing protein [Stigmatella erecta]SEU21835.1 hypothetical protein SAMN05443639_11056 [Stigmatella erecta]